jgi:PIN domain nuclease of toxin-antitoxin system
VILLDTHIWVWLVGQTQDLRPRQLELLEEQSPNGLGVSIISCWEVAKLVEKGRLVLQQPVGEWITAALNHPHITLLSLTPEIAVDSTQLPPGFHSDPADQLIVATSRVLNIPLLTADDKIIKYPHVSLLR